MIMEVRTYRLQPGVRTEFVEFFRTQSIPRMQAAGMSVVGQFSSVSDPDVFAYVRTFSSVEQREEQYRRFYESEDWLGGMIDFAIGKEESFDVFLGDDESEPQTLPLSELSGVHSARFTLASIKGHVVEVSEDSIVVGSGSDETLRFAIHPGALLWWTPTGHGTDRATPIGIGDLSPGDHVLVLGAQSEAGPVARQIVKRPAS